MFRIGDKVERIEENMFECDKEEVKVGYVGVVTSTADGGKWLGFGGHTPSWNAYAYRLAEDKVKKFKLQTEFTLEELDVLSTALSRGYCVTLKHARAECCEIIHANRRKTVQVGGKTYYEDELATALSSIKEV